MTDRLPFDPDKMAAPRRARPAGDAPLSVSQLAERIGGALAQGFPASIHVIGEVSGFRERTHWYFDLKDASAVVNCAMFAAAARKVRFVPGNGQEVVVTGRIDFYEKQGRVSLIVERIEPVGAGALELAFRALCEELRALGWFDPARKRPIPLWPRRVAVVTSRSGAALQDVLDTFRRRCPALQVALIDVRVQGDGAAAEIAEALAWLGRRHAVLGIDVVLLTRGGGSMEDLWAFNERIVAQAVVNSPVPVVAAIGHETDTTIAELAADLRCATPTQAAMRIAPDSGALSEQVDALAGRLAHSLRRRLDVGRFVTPLASQLRLTAFGRLRSAGHRLEVLASRLDRHRPAAAQARREELLRGLQTRLESAARTRLARINLDRLSARFQRAAAIHLERASSRLASVDRQLAAVGPMGVLRRGFSYTVLEDGRLLRSPTEVRPGDRLRTRLADGEVASRVENPEITSQQPQRSPLAKPAGPSDARRSRSSPPRPPADQMDLFGSGR